jgi:hypothetical protein
MNQQIADAYKYHRQLRPTLTAKRALEYARDDAKAGKRRYPSSTHYTNSRVNPPWQSGSATLRWIEKPSSIGLRLVGYADEIISLRHKGWYTNDYQEETIRGIVYQWPARNGKERFVYGYEDPNGNGNAAALCFDVADDKDDAARWADSVAEYAAEEEREYNAASDARIRFDGLADDISAERKSLLQLIRELKEKRATLCDAPVIIATLQTSIERGLDVIREAREKRAELKSDFSYHAGWSQG